MCLDDFFWLPIQTFMLAMNLLLYDYGTSAAM